MGIEFKENVEYSVQPAATKAMEFHPNAIQDIPPDQNDSEEFTNSISDNPQGCVETQEIPDDMPVNEAIIGTEVQDIPDDVPAMINHNIIANTGRDRISSDTYVSDH